MGVSIARDMSDLNAMQQELQYKQALNDVYMKKDLFTTDIIAKSSIMLELMQYVRKIARFPTTIFIV